MSRSLELSTAILARTVVAMGAKLPLPSPPSCAMHISAIVFNSGKLAKATILYMAIGGTHGTMCLVSLINKLVKLSMFRPKIIKIEVRAIEMTMLAMPLIRDSLGTQAGGAKNASPIGANPRSAQSTQPAPTKWAKPTLLNTRPRRSM